MKYKYDAEADAIYVYLSNKPYAYGKDLDEGRRIDYASDSTPIGVELLGVSEGVNIDGLPKKEAIAEVLEIKGIKIYTIETKRGYSGTVFDVILASSSEGRGQCNVRFKKEVTA